MSEVLQTCAVWDFSFLASGMDHKKNLKAKEFRALICYHFRLENMEGGPNKFNLWRLLPRIQ